MSAICGIYKVTNIINNKVIVGQSIHIANRWTKYRHCLRNNTYNNPHLQKSWNKYGENNFDFVVVENNIPEIDLLVVEQRYINKGKEIK